MGPIVAIAGPIHHRVVEHAREAGYLDTLAAKDADVGKAGTPAPARGVLQAVEVVDLPTQFVQLNALIFIIYYDLVFKLFETLVG